MSEILIISCFIELLGLKAIYICMGINSIPLWQVSDQELNLIFAQCSLACYGLENSFLCHVNTSIFQLLLIDNSQLKFSVIVL